MNSKKYSSIVSQILEKETKSKFELYVIIWMNSK